ncbi:RNB-domain-containing protein [Xylariomycetidae sp. FL2044]|nr:RNB-domain-containing protein [Xylariomycetidae sp. FL2044]
MLQASNRSYVCWRCAGRTLRTNAFSKSGALRSQAPFYSTSFLRRSFATVRHSPSNKDIPKNSPSGEEQKLRPLRERLRTWEEENPDKVQSLLTDHAQEGDLANTMTRPQNVTMAQFDVSTPIFDGDELGDLRSDDAILHPGDMVELSSETSRRPVLAVCLGRFNGYEHYYTSSGKWFCGLGVRALFVVPRFVTRAELEPVVSELPSTEIPVEALNTMQDLGHGPSRTAGAAILHKMMQFAQDAEAVYQANAGTLDASSSFIGDPVKHRYLTLHEIADLLLPESDKQNGKFSAASLYAVHQSLLQDEIFFRPLKQIGHRRSYLFEVSPLSEVHIIQQAEHLVRRYIDGKSRKPDTRASSSPVEDFISQAQSAIDKNRKNRQWTQSGIIGPSKEPGLMQHNWSSSSVALLKFIELWASYQKFPKYSTLQTIGSTLLRAIDRYQEAEALSPSTGWTFLQEVNWIPPWEIPARYSVRFPDVEIKRGGGYVRPFFGLLDRQLKRDVLSILRKEWTGLTAFAIDSESTVDIDDAVSVERTQDPHEFWIHIHVADPASSIPPETPLAHYAGLIPQTIYLPGHFERMLPNDLGADMFSLAPGRPCLTFSALVNDSGVVLNQKITPGILEHVVYATGEDVAEAIGESRKEPLVEGSELRIGHIPAKQPPNRDMTRAKDFTEEQKSDLSLLSRLGKAIEANRLSKGAIPYFQPRPEAQVYFNNVEQKDVNGFISTSGDPSIRIGWSNRTGTDLVENIMKLAGEVAARWCHEREIPIPYRTQPLALRNAALVQQYTQDVFYPLLNAGVRPNDSQLRHMMALLGSDEISTKARPHFTIGADMYTKATSPLRRFSDLIVHWQIEAALLEEHRRGRDLKGNKDGDAFLPFDRERLDRILPMLRLREKQVRSLSNYDGTDQWILQALVRAWRFGEATLPDTFRFTVSHVSGRSSIKGRLDWFDQQAILLPDALNDLARMAQIRVGDVFEVKLKDVNVHAKQILVEAVQLLEGTPPEQQFVSSVETEKGEQGGERREAVPV